MKRKIALGVLALALLAPAAAVIAKDDDNFPRWFRDFLQDLEAKAQQILARLSALEQQTAQNTTAISQNAAATAQNTAAINQLTASTAQNAAAITALTTSTAQNTAAIQQNTADIAQNAQTMNTAIQQAQAAIALNTADIAHNSLDISHNSANIAQNTADIAALQGSAQASYAFSDYAGTTIATKTFNASGPSNCGNSEIQIFTRTPQPDGSILLSIDQDRRLNGNRCQYASTRFRIDDSGQALEGNDNRNTADPTVVLTSANLDVPIPSKLAIMHIGQTWGSASRSTLVNFTQGGTTSIGFNTITTTLLAVESVTVPAGTFTDCLRTVEVRNTAHFGVLSQVDWSCRGLGLVRRLQAANSLQSGNVTLTGGLLLELQSYTTQ
jgi:hypothetical protein